MSGKAILSSRYSRELESLMEAFLGILFLMVVNVLFFQDDPGFMRVQPHPFLFLTILIASRYGTFDGFITGSLCATIYAAYLFADKDLEFIRQSFEWHQMIEAYLFVIMGVLLGEIRSMSDREVQEAKKEAEISRLREREAKEALEAVTKVKEELQRRILSAEDPLARFYESASKISIINPEEGYPAIMDLVEKFVGAEKFALYLARQSDYVASAEPKVFEIRFSRGFERPDEFGPTLTSAHPAVAKALESRQVVTAREATGQSDIIACAPLCDPKEGIVFGLIVIHRMPFIRLTRLAISHLETIAGWAAKTLYEAWTLRKAAEARVDDDLTGLYNYSYMARRLAEEVQRVKRYGGELSLLLVKVVGIETCTLEDRRLVMREFGEAIRRLLRTVDVVGAHRIPGVYQVILPQTSLARAVVVTARLNEAFRQKFGGLGSRFAHLSLKMGLAGTTQGDNRSEADLIAEAERFQLL